MRGTEEAENWISSALRRRLRGDVIAVYYCLMGLYRKAGTKLISKVHGNRRRGNRQAGTWETDVRHEEKKFFTLPWSEAARASCQALD